MVTIKQFISSYSTAVALLAINAFVLAAATFIEKYMGTTAAKLLVYYSPFFFFLQFLLVVNYTAIVVKRRLLKRRNWGMAVIHLSFVVILAGAMITHLFGREGTLHLREGEKSDRMTVHTSKETAWHTLPFTIELVNFTLTRYPGSASPSSYESEVLVHIDGQARKSRIFMNNVLDVQGYRFYQASYDKDEKGSVLSVSKDVAGRSVTYTGYLLLVTGFILGFTGKNSRFRQLNRQLKELRTAAVVLTAFTLAVPLIHAGEPSMPDAVQKQIVAPAHAARFGALPMQSYKGRLMPVNTFSSEVLRKLHKADKIGNINSDQFLLSLLAMPDMWMRVPFIAIPNKDLAGYFDLTPYCSYIQMFDGNGNYILQEKLEDAHSKTPAQRSAFDKDLIKLDEQVNIFYQLTHYQMLNIFPRKDAPNYKWYAAGDDLSVFAGKDSLFVTGIFHTYLRDIRAGMKEGNWEAADQSLERISAYQAENKTFDIDNRKIATELLYNRLNIFRICKIGYLTLGGVLLLFAFLSLFDNRKLFRRIMRLLWAVALAVFLFHLTGIVMRWFIGGHAPWSNSYETMVYVSWASVCAGLLFYRRSAITFALAVLFGGIILFVSGLNWLDPQIGVLAPVLKSPWLMFHVAVIVAAYGFFGIGCLTGIANLFLLSLRGGKRDILFVRVKELSIVNEMSLLTGLALMATGTVLGAVWANESWGRYWGWDPKETWALITVIAYAIVLHLRLVKKWDSVWLFNLTSVLAFSSVLMTWFGVNYFLSGMHSYSG
ncbi:MAG: cytochrome c biogenesis protein [Bacteroidales bacterium]